MDRIHAAKKQWKVGEWKARVAEEIRKQWGGVGHGGKRIVHTQQLQSVAKKRVAVSCAPRRQPVAPEALDGGEKSAEASKPVTPAGSAHSKPNRSSSGSSSDSRSSDNSSRESSTNAISKDIAPLCLGELRDSATATANVVGVGAATMSSTCAGFEDIPFTPQTVANWLYQASAYAVLAVQSRLGTNKRFDSEGHYKDVTSGEPASGGQMCAFWGTELGSRRDQGLISHDYDADFAVFKTVDFDFGGLWRQVNEALAPLGLRCVEHTPGFKYRISPTKPLAYNARKELYQETREKNPGVGRVELFRRTGRAQRAGEVPATPHGCNCVDIEVYDVIPGKPIKIIGSTSFNVSSRECFPFVEGIWGPLRLPLPRSPTILNQEYGSQWRQTYSVKVIDGAGNSKYKTADGRVIRRVVWPNVPIQGCPALVGAYVGAGVHTSSRDVPWRFL